MKVLMINGSPNEHGCTFTALSEVAKPLAHKGIETEILWIGKGDVPGCTACRACRKNGVPCVIQKGSVSEAAEKLCRADALVIGSPVYYAGAAGQLIAFLDRMFFSMGHRFMGKPCACLCSARRGGTTAALDQLNKYPLISGMPLVASQYWNMVHGNTPDEVQKDLEGMQIMRRLGLNLAWLLACIEAGPSPYPLGEERAVTNFIR